MEPFCAELEKKQKAHPSDASKGDQLIGKGESTSPIPTSRREGGDVAIIFTKKVGPHLVGRLRSNVREKKEASLFHLYSSRRGRKQTGQITYREGRGEGNPIFPTGRGLWRKSCLWKREGPLEEGSDLCQIDFRKKR